jgi:hypothetical protein
VTASGALGPFGRIRQLGRGVLQQLTRVAGDKHAAIGPMAPTTVEPSPTGILDDQCRFDAHVVLIAVGPLSHARLAHCDDAAAAANGQRSGAADAGQTRLLVAARRDYESRQGTSGFDGNDLGVQSHETVGFGHRKRRNGVEIRG